MKQLFFGLLIVIGLVSVQALFRLLRDLRLKRHWSQAQEALEKKDLPRAEKELKKCVTIMPLWMMPRIYLGFVIAKQGNIQDGESHLKLAVEMNPKQAEGYLQLGYFYSLYCPHRDEDAFNALAKAIEIDPALREKLFHEKNIFRLRQHPRWGELFPTQGA